MEDAESIPGVTHGGCRLPLCSLIFGCVWLALFPCKAAEPLPAPDYARIQSIFDKHCVDCHAAGEPEAGLIMEDFKGLMKGGDSGLALVPGKSADSLLVKMVEGSIEKDGKKLIMPPGKKKKLSGEEIALLKSWIDGGAQPPSDIAKKKLDIPRIEPKGTPRDSINSLAYAPSNKIVAVARHGQVDLIASTTRAKLRTVSGHNGAVNTVAFSPDGQHLFAGAGDAGISGEVRQWDVKEGKLIRVFEGHTDAIYAVAISPDGKTLASGSYDQKIKLWNTETGEEIKTLGGHNGAVFGLAFRRDGKILASASANRTIKLWDVATGERRDTLSQPLKDQHAVAFSIDGRKLIAGGADNRIRVWEISLNATETTNPLLESRFAHEGAILRLAYSADGKSIASSADDRTVKIWDAADIKERVSVEKAADWPTGLAWAGSRALAVGLLDGTLEFHDPKTGKILTLPAPALSYAEPRGIPRGSATPVSLIGSNLVNLQHVRSSSSNLTGKILEVDEDKASEVLIELHANDTLRPGVHEVWVSGANGESGKIKIHVDTLPQIVETNGATNVSIKLPVNVWGQFHMRGDTDEFTFSAAAGETIVFDLQAKAIESKANAVLTLMDPSGKVLAFNNDFDGSDPFIAHTFKEAGGYTIRVSELTLGSATDSFYRLTAGALPYVTGGFPLSAKIGAEIEVQLAGYNLPSKSAIKLKPEKSGEMDVPIDGEKFRTRKMLKIVASDMNELIEIEPNNEVSTATAITVPASINGRIFGSDGNDEDWFRFEAKKGQTWILETQAAQRGTPVDTRIEVFDAKGQALPRIALQAVRDTAINFRPVSSDATGARLDNYEEMELNQYLYLNGEVVRFFRMPQGPDSEMIFYTLGGKRRAYFDTSPIAHSLEEPGYIVEPAPPGAKPAANGLPLYTVPFANDDDSERRLGADSKLFFTAPADGTYHIHLTDTRGASGDRNAYRLLVREPNPDFKVTVNLSESAINAGSGHEFTVTAQRIDGFDGEITVEIADLPKGFSASTPLTIQAGHSEAKGTLNASLDAPKVAGTNATRITATADVNGKKVVHKVDGLTGIKLADQPKLFVMFEPYVEGAATPTNPPPYELTIAPGQTISATLRIKRNGHDDLVTFTVENLPHGIIVDNIGLSGVLIPKGESEREIAITAARWVPETDRLCFAQEGQAGKQTSLPLMLHVHKPGSKMTAKSR